MTSADNYRNGQRGAVLVVALIMLVVMTLLVITMIKTAVVDLKIGGASQQAAVNLANADVAINGYLAQPGNTFSWGCLATLTCNQLPGGGSLGPGGSPGPPMDLFGSRAVLKAEPVGCVPGGQVGSGSQIGSLPSIVFDVKAVTTGRFLGVAATGTTVVHQGIQAPAPVGTC